MPSWSCKLLKCLSFTSLTRKRSLIRIQSSYQDFQIDTIILPESSSPQSSQQSFKRPRSASSVFSGTLPAPTVTRPRLLRIEVERRLNPAGPEYSLHRFGSNLRLAPSRWTRNDAGCEARNDGPCASGNDQAFARYDILFSPVTIPTPTLIASRRSLPLHHTFCSMSLRSKMKHLLFAIGKCWFKRVICRDDGIPSPGFQ